MRQSSKPKVYSEASKNVVCHLSNVRHSKHLPKFVRDSYLERIACYFAREHFRNRNVRNCHLNFTGCVFVQKIKGLSCSQMSKLISRRIYKTLRCELSKKGKKYVGVSIYGSKRHVSVVVLLSRTFFNSRH